MFFNWVWSKIGHFCTFFFKQYRPKKNVFSGIVEKKSLSAIKSRSSKSREIKIIPKGLVHGFSPKNEHFSFSYVYKYVLWYSRIKKLLFRI